ncbi:hypothetical protein HDU91_005108 [Kappamyces sp. JEL0680]|nr:hypothetical protein HDU91_005108 [Kappamyces sp. JEL0680]
MNGIGGGHGLTYFGSGNDPILLAAKRKAKEAQAERERQKAEAAKTAAANPQPISLLKISMPSLFKQSAGNEKSPSGTHEASPVSASSSVATFDYHSFPSKSPSLPTPGLESEHWPGSQAASPHGRTQSAEAHLNRSTSGASVQSSSKLSRSNSTKSPLARNASVNSVEEKIHTRTDSAYIASTYYSNPSIPAISNLKATVYSCQLMPDGDWLFTIETKSRPLSMAGYSSSGADTKDSPVSPQSKEHTIFRTLTQVWDLHKQLAHAYPAKRGTNSSPRSLPFLPSKYSTTPEGELESASFHRTLVQFYLERTIRLFTPANAYIGSFFKQSTEMGDYESTSNGISMDLMSDLLDSLDPCTDVANDEAIAIKLSFNGKARSWREPRMHLSYVNLMKHAQQAFRDDGGDPIFTVYYVDDFGEKCPLQGDGELEMLVVSRDKLRLMA